MNNFYVYMYTDKSGVPFYVGKGMGKRFCVSGHLGRQPFLENKIRKVGVDNIKVCFLYRNLTEIKAFELEASYIKQYGRRDLGKGTLCNLTNGGEGVSGISEETRQKISEAAKGRIFSKEHRKKLSIAHTGKKHSGESKKKIGKAQRGEKNHMYGKHYSEETKKKLSKSLKGKIPWNKGKEISEETRQKISNSLRGKNHPMYGKRGESTSMYGKHHSKKTKRKMSKAAKGKIFSEETQQKISKSLKLYWAKKERVN